MASQWRKCSHRKCYNGLADTRRRVTTTDPPSEPVTRIGGSNMASFADVVRAKVAHAPVAPTSSECQKEENSTRDGDTIKPELVAAATNQGCHAEIHPTRATPGEQLPEGLVRNCIGFFLRTRTLEVQIDAHKITRDMTHLKKFVVIAYFVGGR